MTPDLENENIFEETAQTQSLSSVISALIAQQRVIELLTQILGAPTVQAATQTPEAQAEIKEAKQATEEVETVVEEPKVEEKPKKKKKSRKKKAKKTVVDNGSNIQDPGGNMFVTNNKRSFVQRSS